MVTLADAVEAAGVPASGLLTAELLPPVIPETVTLTVVPSGIFVAASATVIGLGVPKGITISGIEKDPVGAAGADTPATEAIRRLGPLARARGPGTPTEAPAPENVIEAVLVKPSIRIRPAPPDPPTVLAGQHPPPDPPATKIDPPLPPIVFATSRTAPPLPPPPDATLPICAWLFPPKPPFAEMLPKRLIEPDEAIRIAPPPPPPPAPLSFAWVPPPPPPDPPIRGRSVGAP
jgi:hypothetical protein